MGQLGGGVLVGAGPVDLVEDGADPLLLVPGGGLLAVELPDEVGGLPGVGEPVGRRGVGRGPAAGSTGWAPAGSAARSEPSEPSEPSAVPGLSPDAAGGSPGAVGSSGTRWPWTWACEYGQLPPGAAAGLRALRVRSRSKIKDIPPAAQGYRRCPGRRRE